METVTVTKIIPSQEQQEIIDAAVQGKNIIVDACAGAGKSSTILHIASALQNKRVIQMTFNASLKFEIREKAKKMGLENIIVHSYHSLNLQYYNNGHEDFGIINTIRTNKSLEKIPKFHIIIIDEAQDMTNLYYNLMRKFMIDTQTPYQLIVMGDSKQCVYNFKGANPKYLSEADKFWPEFTFERLYLRTSFRLTPDIANFINKCVTGEDLIKTVKQSHGKVKYIVEPKGYQQLKKDIDPTYELIKEIKSYISTGKYTEADIMIICPSIKDRTTTGKLSPINLLVNKLSKAGMSIYKTTDDEKFDEKYAQNKCCVSTCHSSKGLERKVIIFHGFSNEYFKFYGRDYNPTICPSTIYVGLTRASEKLTVYQNGEKCLFLQGNIHEIADVKGDINQKSKIMPQQVRPLAITKIIKFLQSELLYDLNDLINQVMICTQEPNNIIELKSEVSVYDPIKNKTFIEHVSDLNGLAIVSRYQNETIADKFSYYFDGTGFVNRTKEEMESRKPTSMAYYLKEANILWAHSENLIYRLNQIKEYTWLDNVNWEQLKKNFKLLSDHKSEVMYEYGIVNKNMMFGYKKDNGRIIYLDGIIDAFADDTIYEFKCTTELTIEHKLQLIFYSWMMHFIYKKDFTCILLNLRTGQTFKLLNNFKIINEICVRIIDSKTGYDYTDEEDRMVGAFMKKMDAQNSITVTEY